LRKEEKLKYKKFYFSKSFYVRWLGKSPDEEILTRDAYARYELIHKKWGEKVIKVIESKNLLTNSLVKFFVRLSRTLPMESILFCEGFLLGIVSAVPLVISESN